MATRGVGTGESVGGLGEVTKQATFQEDDEEPKGENYELLKTAEQHANDGKIKMEIDAKRQIIQEKFDGLYQPTGEECYIMNAVHKVFELYDTDKDGQLSE